MSDGPRRDQTGAGWFIRSVGTERNTNDVRQARWLVTLIGFSAATMLPLGLFIGILTGCQRFDLRILTRCVCQPNGFGLIVILLVSGHGLIARRICPQLCISSVLVRRTDVLEVINVDGKTLLQGMP